MSFKSQYNYYRAVGMKFPTNHWIRLPSYGITTFLTISEKWNMSPYLKGPIHFSLPVGGDSSNIQLKIIHKRGYNSVLIFIILMWIEASRLYEGFKYEISHERKSGLESSSDLNRTLP